MSLSLFFQSATVSDGGKSQFLMYIFIIFNEVLNCERVFAIDSATIGFSCHFRPAGEGFVGAALGELRGSEAFAAEVGPAPHTWADKSEPAAAAVKPACTPVRDAHRAPAESGQFRDSGDTLSC